MGGLAFSIPFGANLPEPIPEYNGEDGWFASPDAGEFANGSPDYPWPLNTALAETAKVLPGDTLWLMPGTYVGNFTNLLTGSEGARLTIRPYNGVAIIDGEFTNGYSDGRVSYTDIRNLIITCSDTNRGSQTSPVGTVSRPSGYVNFAPYSRFINSMILDSGVSIGDWIPANDSLTYGVLVLNGGYMDIARGHGHGDYCQNQTGLKEIKHCLLLPHFGRPLACYTTNQQSRGFRIHHNVFVCETGGDYVLIGGQERHDDQVFDNNHVVGNVVAQFTWEQNGSIQVTNNTIWQPADSHALLVGYWESAVVMGNRINGKSPIGDIVIKEMIRWTRPLDPTGISTTWDSNQYHYRGAEPKMFKIDGVLKTFAEWQAAGHDAGGSYDTLDTLPDEVVVYPNELADADDPRLGIVVVWNGSSQANVSVDLSSMGIANGTPCRLRQALDPLGDTVEVVYNGVSVSVDMTPQTRTVAAPIGWPVPLVDSPFPRFGAFIVEKQ